MFTIDVQCSKRDCTPTVQTSTQSGCQQPRFLSETSNIPNAYEQVIHCQRNISFVKKTQPKSA